MQNFTSVLSSPFRSRHFSRRSPFGDSDGREQRYVDPETSSVVTNLTLCYGFSNTIVLTSVLLISITSMEGTPSGDCGIFNIIK